MLRDIELLVVITVLLCIRILFLQYCMCTQMILLYKDPDGKAVFEKSNPVTHAMDTSGIQSGTLYDFNVYTLL